MNDYQVYNAMKIYLSENRFKTFESKEQKNMDFSIILLNVLWRRKHFLFIIKNTSLYI